MNRLTTILLLVAVVAIGYWYATPGPPSEEEAARALRKSLVRDQGRLQPVDDRSGAAAFPSTKSRAQRSDGDDWRDHFSEWSVGPDRQAELREEIALLSAEREDALRADDDEVRSSAQDYADVIRLLTAELHRSEDPLGPDMARLPDWK